MAPAEAQGSTGILAGRVTGWPGGPVEGGGIPPGSAGAAGVEILVTHVDGRPAASARTDAQGEFRLTLPAGTYQIAVAGLRPGEFVKGLPRAATIRPGTDTRVEIRIDSGVR